MRSLVILCSLGFICLLLPKDSSGLQCYSCNPPDCDKYTKETCSQGLDQCLSALATVGDKKFNAKACANKPVCDLSQSIPGVTLENVKCCQKDLCNGAESFTLSFLLMIIPLLSSILFY